MDRCGASVPLIGRGTFGPAASTRQAGSDDAAEAAEHAPVPTTEAKKRASSVAMSKEEIVDDFAAIRGTRPPRRPKKRSRTVQRQLDVRISDLRVRIFGLTFP